MINFQLIDISIPANIWMHYLRSVGLKLIADMFRVRYKHIYLCTCLRRDRR